MKDNCIELVTGYWHPTTDEFIELKTPILFKDENQKILSKTTLFLDHPTNTKIRFCITQTIFKDLQTSTYTEKFRIVVQEVNY